ncbi:hypothetical protein AB0L44_02910 [Nonomuraea wenchangensis]|uniref:hypothetical protein n=1 Tax=Nonomuraea wenchangensis TaxID=568860 RepID=UPI00343C1FF2
MTNPQQPELRRSGKSATEPKSANAIPETRSGGKRSARPHGTDKGGRGGGKGGGVPPGQQSPHPE